MRITPMREMTPKQEAVLIKRTLRQINQRDVAVPFAFYTRNADRARKIIDRKKKPSMWLMRAKYWADYSSREGWWVRAVYLAGHSDGQDWAVRVPSTIGSIKSALDWLTPTPVKNAIRKNKKVYRQGDMYFVPMAISYNDFSTLHNSRHDVIWIPRHPKGPHIVITHPEHPDVSLDWNKTWRAYQQKQLHIGSTRTGAD